MVVEMWRMYRLVVVSDSVSASPVSAPSYLKASSRALMLLTVARDVGSSISTSRQQQNTRSRPHLKQPTRPQVTTRRRTCHHTNLQIPQPPLPRKISSHHIETPTIPESLRSGSQHPIGFEALELIPGEVYVIYQDPNFLLEIPEHNM